MDWQELECCHTGWPLPTGEPNILKTSTAGQIFWWNLYKQCQTQKMTYVSVRRGWRPTRKDVQRRTSTSRVSWITSKNVIKEEAEEESEIFLQDLPEVQPQHSGLLEESKQSIEHYSGQCWCWRWWRGWNRNGLNDVVMLGWWRGQSNCLCSMYNVFCVWYLNRKKSNVWHLKG